MVNGIVRALCKYLVIFLDYMGTQKLHCLQEILYFVELEFTLEY